MGARRRTTKTATRKKAARRAKPKTVKARRAARKSRTAVAPAAGDDVKAGRKRKSTEKTSASPKAARKATAGKAATKKKTTKAKATKVAVVATPAAEKKARAERRTIPAKRPAPSKKSKKPAVAERPRDDAEHGRQLLRELTSLVGRANDRAVEKILGDGSLEGFLAAVLPQKRKPSHSVHQHLAAHKRRASLMAQVRHAINESCAFDDGAGAYVSPTRVQWFYDGLTFLVGSEPFSGVVGLYRDGEVRYGLDQTDWAPGESLGPRDTDFVSLEQAQKVFRGVRDASAGLSQLAALSAEPGDDTLGWAEVLERHPWMLGAQHTSIVRRDPPDDNVPEIFAKRSTDGCHDIVVLGSPSTPVVGKNGKLLSAFHDVWHRAERYLSFVERQSDYLSREMSLKVKDPRCWLVAGAGLMPTERDVVRQDKEKHSASLRFLTYDDLRTLAARTLTFFEPRL